MEFFHEEKYFRDLVVGVNTPVPIETGELVTGINFDNAATTPPFKSVLSEINNFAPWYSSIHRGTGYKSKLSSNLYESSRETIADFVNVSPQTHNIIFCKNTTEAVNKLAFHLCKDDSIILSSFMEHHSNDLPWRHSNIKYIDTDETGRLSLEDLKRKLVQYSNKVKLVTITGASNVTGLKNPIYNIAKLAHRFGVKILVDGAQLVPHCPIDMSRPNNEHIDFLVFSAHKMYAPFGIGVLISPKKIFCDGEPHQVGGGTVKVVTPDFILWDNPPQKEEAGTPNIMGVVALQAAIRQLKVIDMKNIERYEKFLTEYALHKLNKISDLTIYGNTKNFDEQVSIISFNIRGLPHRVVANALSDEAGIAVRNGCFCAQPYVQKLLNLSSKVIKSHVNNPDLPHPGMVRISFGLYNNCNEIDQFIYMINKLVSNKNFYINKYKSILYNMDNHEK